MSTNGLPSGELEQYDVLVYGGTAGGVASAVQAARMGKRVVLIEPSSRLGGMTTNGLGNTDTGRPDAIGGLAREFYLRVAQQYSSQASEPRWRFSPSKALAVMEQWAATPGITLVRNDPLDLGEGGVINGDGQVRSIRLQSGRTFAAQVFIDAGYEGDLLARAGVRYHVGREANSVYGETYNGVQKARSHNHIVPPEVRISPYVEPGNPESGLIYGVSDRPPGQDGQGDHRLQAYNFRMCLTQASNRLPWTKPQDYDPARYELLKRWILQGNITGRRGLVIAIALGDGNFDVNNCGPVSTNFIGGNYDYPHADHATRRQIVQAHRQWQQGLMYFLANDPSLPASVREAFQGFGPAPGEFTENDGWPEQLYIREARRMIGRYVMTDQDVLGRRQAPEPVALGAYTMDSHNCQRYVDEQGHVRVEGNLEIRLPRAYGISYRSITPEENQASNLLVVCAVSASHIAYGSIRMEPVFMELGQTAGTAAAMAIDAGTSVQQVPYEQLRQRLLADGARLE